MPFDIEEFIRQHGGITKVYVEPVSFQHTQILDLSRALNSNIEIPSPAGLEYYPFQKAGIEYASKRAMTLIADEMGL